LIKKILNNQFFKIFSYNSIIVFGKVISSFVVSKVSAIYLGPSGFAIVGNFRNVLQGVLGITSSGFQSGVIKHIAESKYERELYSSIVSSVFALSLFISLLIAPVLFIFSEALTVYILKEVSYAFVFKYFALLLPLISFNFLILNILNGLQKLKLYTIISSVLNVLNALLTFLCIYFYSLEGALIASLLVPAFCFVTTFLFKDIRKLVFRYFFRLKNVSYNIVKSVSVYLGMAIYSTILISISYLLIRNKIISSIDLETAGLWEAMNKVSTFYMLFFSSLLTLYLLPKLSQNITVNGFKNIMIEYFKFVLPLVIILFLVIFISRLLIIRLFLTEDFLHIQNLFYLQLVGDFLKIVGFSFAYQFHAKKMLLPYFISDALLYISFYLLSIFLIDIYELLGVYYAYICSFILYLLTVIIFIYLTRYKYLKAND